MNNNKRYFDPKLYYYKVIALCLLMCIDIVMNSFTQFLTFGHKETKKFYSATCKNNGSGLCIGLSLIQFALQIIMFFILLSIFSETFDFKRGLLKRMCRKFMITFFSTLFYIILFIAEKIYLYIYHKKNKEKKDVIFNIWKQWHFLLFYILKFIFAFLSYMFTINTSFELGKPKYYKVELEGLPQF
jgi:hypothetical protein